MVMVCPYRPDLLQYKGYIRIFYYNITASLLLIGDGFDKNNLNENKAWHVKPVRCDHLENLSILKKRQWNNTP